MEKKIYKAFVSSTYTDLYDHRAHVISALQKSGFFVDPMENWTSDSDEPKIFSQERVEGCDLFILLVAFRRGFVPEGEEYSITQLEYRHAVNEGIDVLVFLLDDEAPWPRRHDEMTTDEGIHQWRQYLKAQHGVGTFSYEPNSLDVGPAITRWSIKVNTQSVPNATIVDEPILQKPIDLRAPVQEGQLMPYLPGGESPFPEEFFQYFEPQLIQFNAKGYSGGFMPTMNFARQPNPLPLLNVTLSEFMEGVHSITGGIFELLGSEAFQSKGQRQVRSGKDAAVQWYTIDFVAPTPEKPDHKIELIQFQKYVVTGDQMGIMTITYATTQTDPEHISCLHKLLSDFGVRKIEQ